MNAATNSASLTSSTMGRQPSAAIFPKEVFSPNAEMEMTSAQEEASPARS